MPLDNQFISYVDRSYEQTVQANIDKIPVYVPEITDISDGNPFIKFIKIWGGLFENLQYYLDSKARESYIVTCRKFSSAIKIAKQFNYRVRGYYPASVTIRFYVDSPSSSIITIPANTEIQSTDGVSFLTLATATIPIGQTFVNVGAKQFTKETIVLGTSDNSPNQKFVIPIPSGYVGGVVDSEITITNGSDVFSQVDSLVWSGANSLHILCSLNENGQMEANFGDNVNGKIPSGTLTANYYVSQGSFGNISRNKITNIINSLTLPSGVVLKCNNPNNASGGVDAESLADLKKNVPNFIRTIRKAVTIEDYKLLAQMASGVAKSEIDFSTGKTVKIYIVPTGGGIASQTLLDNVSTYFDKYDMLTTTINVLAAGQIRMKITINVNALPNYYNSTVQSEVIAALVAFGSVDNQEIKGTINLGDLYQKIENLASVDYSDIVSIIPTPYANKVLGVNDLSAEIDIQPGSVSNVLWELQIVDATHFHLFKNSLFVGEKPINQTIELPEMFIKVLPSTYQIGDKWSFYSYPYSGRITLQEYSIPVILEEDIDITVTGGL